MTSISQSGGGVGVALSIVLTHPLVRFDSQPVPHSLVPPYSPSHGVSAGVGVPLTVLATTVHCARAGPTDLAGWI